MDTQLKVIEFKKWDEQTVEQKLETIREELRNMRYLNTRMNNTEADIQLLLEHEHGTDGKPVQKLKKQYNLGSLNSSIDRLA